MRLSLTSLPFAIVVTMVALGCSPDAQVSALAYLAPPLTREMLTVTVRDGGHWWAWRGRKSSRSRLRFVQPVVIPFGSCGVETRSAIPSSTDEGAA
jgi:hypothetical protein